MAFTDCVGPGPRSLAGLGWLARVGASTPEPLELVMGWGDRVARDHVTRLVRAGLVERVAMRRGGGSLIVATSAGVREAGYPATRALRSVAPTSWAHVCGCGWVSAWLHLRIQTHRAAGAQDLGWWSERDIASDGFWRREVRHKEYQRGTVRVTHRPDLGLRFGGLPVPVEVELKRKSRARLRGILAMYRDLSAGEGARLGGVMYVTANPDITENLRRAAGDVGVREELISFRGLDDVIKQTRAGAHQRAAHRGRLENGDTA